MGPKAARNNIDLRNDISRLTEENRLLREKIDRPEGGRSEWTAVQRYQSDSLVSITCLRGGLAYAYKWWQFKDEAGEMPLLYTPMLQIGS